MKALVTITLLFCLLLPAGCSSLQMKQTENFAWSGVSRVALTGPTDDPWQLTPIIKTELTAMGVAVAPRDGDPDLLIDFSFREGPDLGADSEVLTRLKSLHLRFTDPATQTPVAAIDYFYPFTGELDPAGGAREALAALRQQLASSGETSPTMKTTHDRAPAPVAAKANETPTTAPAATMPASRPAEAAALPEDPAPRSPWLPRLQSWGFENWGGPGKND